MQSVRLLLIFWRNISSVFRVKIDLRSLKPQNTSDFIKCLSANEGKFTLTQRESLVKWQCFFVLKGMGSNLDCDINYLNRFFTYCLLLQANVGVK
jgi:hypothetical protein